ncbi:MFS transporter [uncultured Tolumonas sp.]|uniref:MFS transporter n=1 Tax=uncultured Tolumonas sp. TaxID=263765 RepID=UPI00292F7A84|nr:MFS transporter [uncultured Tolumonas sp.]
MSINEYSKTKIASQEIDQETTAYWGGVLAMTLCVFVLVASEFMPVSLLTPMAMTFKVSEGLIGQGVSISGATALIASLLISILAGNVDRRTLLLWMTALMLMSGVMIALSPSYAIYMIGRTLIGISIGGFWALSAATAIRLVPSAQVPKALTIFNSGNALAMVIAAPLGSYLGNYVGWRGAFLCLIPVALISFIWQWICLPSMTVQQENQPTIKGMFRVVIKPLNRFGFIAAGLFFMGQFCLFTYIRPFLEHSVDIVGSKLSLILLVMGVMGFLGTTVIGGFLRFGLYKVLCGIPLLMALIAVALVCSAHVEIAIIILLGLWGFVATAAPVGWWAWLADAMPNDSEIGGGLMVAIVQLSVGIGSTMGGLLFDTSGYQGTFYASAITLVLSLLCSMYCSKLSAVK